MVFFKMNKEKKKEWNKKEKKDLDFRMVQAQADFQPSLITPVQSSGPTWWEERTDSCKLSPASICAPSPTQTPNPTSTLDRCFKYTVSTELATMKK